MATKTVVQDRFNFFVPIELEKSKDDTGKDLVRIKGVASSTAKDSDGEELDPTGFDYTPLLQTGFLNWNHQGQKTSKAICGQPTTAKIINKGKDFYIEGFLYPNEEGKAVAELAETLEAYSPDRRLGFSIEGVATERDIFNKKKVKKAKITGVAITQCPKNPNTLLSIMKGEYADAYIEPEEEEDDETEKAMAVNIDLNPESVEHGKKKNLQTVGDDLKKSDIYDIIIDRYTINAPVKEIYSFVKTVSQKLFNMTTPTKESLEKALSLVDEAADSLVKGKETETTIATEEADKKKLEKGGDITKLPASGVEEDTNDGDVDMKKAKDTAGILYKAGMDRDAACDTMSKGGISLSVAQGAYDSVVADANKNKDGGDMSALGGDLIKAVQGELGKAIEPFRSLGTDVTGIKDAISKGFSGVSTALKALGDANTELVQQNEELKKSNEALNERLEKVEKQPAGGRKSVTRSYNDRFEKSQDGQGNNAVPTDCEQFDVTNKTDLSKLSNRIMAEIDLVKSKNPEANTDILEKAVEQIEVANHVPESAYAHLRAMKCILVDSSKS